MTTQGFDELACSHNAAWAVMDLGGARLGDRRRTERLVTLAATLVEHPAQSLPGACGNWAATKAAYRFFSNEAVDAGQILKAHRKSTLERVRELPMVLGIQDTTVYNFGTHQATKGLGPIVRQRRGYVRGIDGFFVHSCLAVSPEGLPLGLLGQHLWVRPTAEKESQRWQVMLEKSTRGVPATTRLLTVADREADIYSFFETARRLHQDVLVRAVFNRRLQDEEARLWDTVASAPVLGTLRIEVPRADERPSRTADLELRSIQVTLRPPTPKSGFPDASPMVLRAILAREVHPPADQEPVEWRLLTTLPVPATADVIDCIGWYAQRWKVERYHFTLKSGCQVEELQLEDITRLHRALAVYAVVAWRLLHLTYLARLAPHQPCTVFFTSSEWQALYCTIHRTKQLPQSPPDLRTAVLWVARLGGFLARKRDGNPGVKVIWSGYRRLQDLVEMWDVLHQDN